jgi:hypothetical protein
MKKVNLSKTIFLLNDKSFVLPHFGFLLEMNFNLLIK